MVTRTCLAPEGWTVEGGARWTPQAPIEDWVTEHFRATSPDGQALIELLPPYRWMPHPPYAGAPGRFGPPLTAGQVLEQVIGPFVVKGPVPARATRDPDRAVAIAERERTAPGYARVAAIGGRLDADAAELRFTAASRSGPREEHLRCGLVVVTIPGGMGAIQVFSADEIWRTSAPAGADYAEAFAVVLGSMRTNPEWASAVRQVRESAHAQQRAASAMNHQITMDGIRRMTEVMSHQGDWLQHVRVQDFSGAHDDLHASWQLREESADLSARRMSETIREVDAWRSDGGFVELPSGYQRAWTNGQGDYVVTNDVGFDASRLDGAWTPLTKRDG
jgi:hypothetical protein